MNGILSWLDNFFTAAGREIDSTVASVVHWALRAITSLVFGQFQNTQAAWTVYYTQTRYFTTQLRELSTATRGAHHYTLGVRIPAVVSWAAGYLARLLSALTALARAVGKDVASLDAKITAGLAALARWVTSDVYDPLLKYAKSIEAGLLKWGYTAWWWITHLDALADAMIFHIAISLEKNAWQLATILGKFTLSLILANARKIAVLAEDIITAVL